MVSIGRKLAVTAFILTGATAQAASIEVVFDVTAQTRALGEQVNPFDMVDHPDLTFSPVTFSISMYLDMGKVIWQSLSQFHVPYVAVGFGNAPVFTSTPFTSTLLVPAPANADISTPHGNATYYKNFTQAPLSNEQPLPEWDQARFSTSDYWTAPTDGSADITTVYNHGMGIAFTSFVGEVPVNQLKLISGPDLAAFLQGQIGKVQTDAFHEYGLLGTTRPSIGGVEEALSGNRIMYRGDVVIRSVTVVPEPDTLLLSLVGMGVAALSITRRRRARSAICLISN